MDTDRIIKLGLDKFPSDQDFVLHGFGLYVSSADANDITLFFINHRRPGSVIDIFSHTLGTSTITYTQTYKHAMLKSPNGIAPLSADSFLVTNDLCNPTGPKRLLELVFRRAGGSIQYHSTTEKAKIVAHDVVYPNGIAFSPATSQAWVCSSTTPELLIYNYDADMNRLKLRERVALLSMCDNVHISPTSGHVYTAGIVNPLAYLKMVKYSKDLGARGGVASRAVRVVNNTGEDVFYGRKYKVETLLVSDGEFMGGGWAVAAPEESRGKVLVGGQYVQGIAVCDLP
ncbi:hypothetical protein HK097_001496 [Rhizophlyctis rosea]|uniref:Uncharacterized protein n=1 Tax=Rhizophlyctis rosea TaxID=64517 RepID=A0AAD5SML2_9FUNG|nr:hypothetical protein HK097_001496 [Rhizophlyctis rosea]